MKTNYLIAMTLICAAAVWLGMTPESIAGDGHGHEGGHDAHHEAQPGAVGDDDQRTATELWAAIDADVERLRQTIDGGRLADVHQTAFAIRDLVNELSAKSTDLPEAKQKLLTNYVARVDEHAKNLDTYGDVGDAERTAAELGELEKRLWHMEKLYQKPASSDAHKGHSHESE